MKKKAKKQNLATKKALKKNIKKATPRKKRSKRGYNNEKRQVRSQKTQTSLIENYVKLLVQRKGAEVKMNELAKITGVSERTIFRFFKNKEDIQRSTEKYLQTFLVPGMDKIQTLSLSEFAKNVFNLFDQYENLVLAYMFSAFGQEARRLFRLKLNKALEEKILKTSPNLATGNGELPHGLKIRVGLIVTLINVKIWYDIKTDYNYTGTEIGNAVAWAIDVLVQNLSKGQDV